MKLKKEGVIRALFTWGKTSTIFCVLICPQALHAITIDVTATPHSAVCDDSADASMAINNAITAVETAGGGNVIVPNTSLPCKINSTIVVKPKVRLVCEEGASIKMHKDVNANVVQLEENGAIEGCEILTANLGFTEAVLYVESSANETVSISV